MGATDYPIQVAQEDIILMPERCAFWPSRATLLIADLHLGKAETYQACGLPLPGAAVAQEQLDRLARAARRVAARRILILGDLLHGPIGITEPLLAQVAQFLAQLEVRLEVVTGNHDRRLDLTLERWPLHPLGEEHDEGPFRFVHDPASARRGTHTWGGHIHPAVALGRRADRIKLPCFVVGRHRSILPAFSRFASGGCFDVEVHDEVFAVGEGEVFAVPNRAPARAAR